MEDEESIQNYVVVAQDIPAGTEITFTYLKDSNGEEYSNLIDSATYEDITLYVKRISQ